MIDKQSENLKLDNKEEERMLFPRVNMWMRTFPRHKMSLTVEDYALFAPELSWIV
jgi:hypothetical protein